MTPHADLILQTQMPWSIFILYETIISTTNIDLLTSDGFLFSMALQQKNKNSIWWSTAQTVYKASCNGCLDAKCNRAAKFHLFHKLGRHYAVLPNTSWCTEVRWPSFLWHVYYVLRENATNTKSRWYHGPCETLAGPFREIALSFVLWRGLTAAAPE